MPRFGKLVEGMIDKWAETHYRRLSAREVKPLLSEFVAYYQSLGGKGRGGGGVGDGGWPRWSDFDLIRAPRPAITFLAVAGAVYAQPEDRRPDHFVYHLQGRGVDQLIGEDMKGRRVSRVVRQVERTFLQGEIDEAIETGAPVYSHARLALPERSDLIFHRGVFLFADEAGRPDRMVLYLERDFRENRDLSSPLTHVQSQGASDLPTDMPPAVLEQHA